MPNFQLGWLNTERFYLKKIIFTDEQPERYHKHFPSQTNETVLAILRNIPYTCQHVMHTCAVNFNLHFIFYILVYNLYGTKLAWLVLLGHTSIYLDCLIRIFFIHGHVSWLPSLLLIFVFRLVHVCDMSRGVHKPLPGTVLSDQHGLPLWGVRRAGLIEGAGARSQQEILGWDTVVMVHCRLVRHLNQGRYIIHNTTHINSYIHLTLLVHNAVLKAFHVYYTVSVKEVRLMGGNN